MITVFGLYLLPQLRRLGRVYEYWTQYKLARYKLKRFLARKRAPVEGKRIRLGTGEPVDIEIELSGKPLFSAPAGSKIMLIDAQRSLASALIHMLDGGSTSEPMERILINDTAVDSLSSTERKRRIVIVSSNVQLWSGTLKHNLTYGMRRGSDEELNHVLDICGLNPLIDRLAEGLETRLKPHSHSLADQECFGVQLCRALLRKPSLIVIDHPVAHQALLQGQQMADVAGYFKGTLIMLAETEIEPPDWIDTVWKYSETPLPAERLREAAHDA
jgi:ABC-type transport system involved in cytochrome bd biosynthesis fused ATPase/permease subunit